MRRAIRAGQLATADQKRGGEGIGGGAVASDDGSAANAGRGPAGARIEDVTVAAAVDVDELLAGAAGAESAVAQVESCEPRGWRAGAGGIGIRLPRMPCAQI